MRFTKHAAALLAWTVATCLAAATAAGVAGAAGTSSAAPPRAALTGFACGHGLDPVDRTVGVLGVMRPLPGTRQLAIRFSLLSRDADTGSVSAIRGTGLGSWITPTNPTLGRLPGDVWRLQKTVVNLAAPAAYRFRVSFRWTGAHGRVLASAVRWTRWCSQRELRPDLVVRSLTVSAAAGRPAADLYTAVIADEGNTGAGPFEVLFAPGDGAAVQTTDVGFLGAHRTRTVTFTGPACQAGSPPTVTADAAGEVDDLDRSNNAATAVCPAAGGS